MLIFATTRSHKQPLTNHFNVPNEARIASVIDNLRIVQMKINQHQISRRHHVAAIMNSSSGVFANQFRHPSVPSVSNADALRRTRKHKIIQVELYLMTFLNLRNVWRVKWAIFNPQQTTNLYRPHGVLEAKARLRRRCQHSSRLWLQQMNDTTALTVGPDFVHDFRAVDCSESFPTEEVFPYVGDAAAARTRFCSWTLLEREKAHKPH